MRSAVILLAVCATLLAGCGRGVSEARLVNAGPEADSWLTNGRTYDEQRYSPLTQITSRNLDQLGLAWEASLESNDFGVEASPLVADGVLYVTSTWSRVYAFDAKSGRRLWAFDPQVPRDWLRQGCCKAVNRGVALWNDKLYVGAFDGRLFALDARTGHQLWVADTTDHKPYYSITGAPRVVRGKVIIGNGGADFASRGFVSAYDAQTGKLAWRVYVVPRDPKLGQEQPELERAAQTWDPGHDWSKGGGGGGGPWDTLSYDPQLNLLYVGTGNAAPGIGPGDSLFVCSILAIDPDTGRLVWSYQTTPGDHWDFDAVQNLVQADLTIGGRTRKTLMQASKNGFFYVLDRATGELLSAEKYVRVTWADHVDLKTGRPVETPGAENRKRSLLFPSPYGGHNWQPMAYSPQTGLIYIPAQDLGWVWDAEHGSWFYRALGGAPLAADDVVKSTRGLLIAWDPATGRAVWTAGHPEVMNGGVLATAGGFVVQGTADGYLEFYDAAHGQLVRRILIGTGVAAPPISYRVDGVQYIAVAAGWNGVHAEPSEPDAPAPYDNAGRLIVLRLGGGPVPVAARTAPLAPLMAGAVVQPADLVARGEALYHANCGRCHGLVGERTPFPDLRRMRPETVEAFDDIVLRGAYRTAGMASFADVLGPDDTRAIRAYLTDWAARSAGAASATVRRSEETRPVALPAT